MFADRGATRIALTTWETNRLPDRFAYVLSRFDHVIVPSGFCRATMRENEVIRDLEESRYRTHRQHTFIYVVPHCFDEEYWEHTNPKRDDQRSPFRFYSMTGWGERKNPLGLVRAYLHAFSNKDDVELLVLLDGKADFEEIRKVIACSGLTDSLPKLLIPAPRRLDEFELLGLHTEGDCFVTATRGEGWGLGMFEAAIMGKIVIAPAWGGQNDFLDNYERWKAIPSQSTPCWGSENRQTRTEDEAGAVRSTMTIPAGVDCRQLWAEPDLGYLARTMRRTYEENLDGRHLLFNRQPSRDALEARFGYRVVGPQLANLLRGIAWQTR